MLKQNWKFICSLFLSYNIYAQNPVCGTVENYKRIEALSPAIKQNKDALQQFTEEYIQNHASQRNASAVKVIPVVFHVIHNYGPEMISKAQIEDAVRILNEDFRKANPDTNLIVPAFKSIAADCEIEFRLAKIDPNGQCTDGITYTSSQLTYVGTDNVKQLVSWDNDKYLNIWVVNAIGFGTQGGIVAGYAYFPGSASPGNDGIVVGYTYVGGIGVSCGSNFCKRVLTHEVGHYLNLEHPFVGEVTDPGNCFLSDFVSDTPPTPGNYGTCNLNASNCNGVLENVQNYMDYSSCTNMFTQGQKQRMNAALSSFIGDRNNLWSPSNIIATGVSMPNALCAPVADFGSNENSVCAGTSVVFNDLSWNGAVSSWNWSFQGGTPSSSSLASPTITYNTPGQYNVSLTASNSTGADSKTYLSLINVEANSAQYTVSPYSEGFEGASLPNNDWFYSDYGLDGSWYQTNTASYSGNNSVAISSIFPGAVDDLISPSINIAAMPGAVMKFRVAYAQGSGSENDKLAIYVSSNCGRTWQIRYSKTGANLATVAPQWGFVPTSQSDWRQDFVNLAPVMNQPNVLFKFSFTSDNGNALFIDDVNIAAASTSLYEVSNIQNLMLFPNPSTENNQLIFSLLSEKLVEISLFNLLGEKIKIYCNKQLSSGDHTINIENEGLATGTYWMKILLDDEIKTIKYIKN